MDFLKKKILIVTIFLALFSFAFIAPQTVSAFNYDYTNSSFFRGVSLVADGIATKTENIPTIILDSFRNNFSPFIISSNKVIIFADNFINEVKKLSEDKIGKLADNFYFGYKNTTDKIVKNYTFLVSATTLVADDMKATLYESLMKTRSDIDTFLGDPTNQNMVYESNLNSLHVDMKKEIQDELKKIRSGVTNITEQAGPTTIVKEVLSKPRVLEALMELGIYNREDIDTILAKLKEKVENERKMTNLQISSLSQAMSWTNRIDQIQNIKSTGGTFTNMTVNGVNGITDADIPDTISITNLSGNLVQGAGSFGTSTSYATLSVWGDGTGTGQAFSVMNNASTTLFTVLDNGNVGIGTTSPFTTFSVNGDTYIAGNTTFSSFNATSSTATSTIGSGGFAVDGDKFVVEQNSGNVGIGTSSPYTKLSVSGDTVVEGKVYASYFTSTSTTEESVFPNIRSTNSTSTNATSTNLYASNFNSDAATSTYLYASNLNTFGATSSTLYVSGLTQLTNTENSGTLNVTGQTTLGNASTSNLTVSGNSWFNYASSSALTVSGNAWIENASTTNLTASGYTTVEGPFTNNGNTILGNANTDTTTIRGLTTLQDSSVTYPLRFGTDVDLYRGTTDRLDLGTGDSLNLVSGNYQIAGANVLTSTTLGSGITNSSLTQVGALSSGSIVSGFGTIATGNTITGTTLNGTTGINTGAGAGTQRIDASGNLVNIGTITSGLINGQTISSSANFTGSLTSAGIIQSNTSVRGPIFYDSNDTGYYLDPNGTSNLNLVYMNDARSSVYYDKDNAGYYIDGNNTSSLNALTVNSINGGTPITSVNIGAQSVTYAISAGSAGSVPWSGVTDKPFNWAGQSGQPSWLWGSNDGASYYVWNPSNFSVNYANTAGGAPPTGTAGGNLGGTYPNPSIASLPAISGASLTSLTAANISAGTAGISITGNANYANTAGALTSMNISQFTNNSGYITDGNTGWNDIYGLAYSGGNISQFVNDSGYLTSYTETDPQVGTLSAGSWCTTDGSSVNCTSAAPSGGVTGSGTSGYIPAWTGSGSLGDSAIYNYGTAAGVAVNNYINSGLSVSAAPSAASSHIGIYSLANTNGVGIIGRVDSTAFCPIQNGTGVVGCSSSNMSSYDFYAGGVGNVDYGTLSSVRWKNNLIPLDNALSNVLKMRGLYYDWDEAHGGTKNDIGMIAEEVGQFYPQIVAMDPEAPGYATGMDYGHLTPVLVEAIKGINNILNIQNAPTTTPSMFVDSSGNIGIGTSTPAYKLQVMGDVAAQSFVNISTASAKKDIVSLSDSEKSSYLDKISSMNIVKYHYNNENSATDPLHLGLIAEEAPLEVLSVSGKGVDLYKLSAFTLSGVQELGKKLTSLETRITTLESALASTTNLAVLPPNINIFGQFIDYLSSLGAKFTNGIAYFKDAIFEKISIGDANKPTQITVYDKNGKPGCLIIEDVNSGTTKILPGTCADLNLAVLPPSSSDSSNSNITPPVINTDTSTTTEVNILFEEQATTTELVTEGTTPPVINNNEISTTTSQTEIISPILPDSAIIPVTEETTSPETTIEIASTTTEITQ